MISKKLSEIIPFLQRLRTKKYKKTFFFIRGREKLKCEIRGHLYSTNTKFPKN